MSRTKNSRAKYRLKRAVARHAVGIRTQAVGVTADGRLEPYKPAPQIDIPKAEVASDVRVADGMEAVNIDREAAEPKEVVVNLEKLP